MVLRKWEGARVAEKLARRVCQGGAQGPSPSQRYSYGSCTCLSCDKPWSPVFWVWLLAPTSSSFMSSNQYLSSLCLSLPIYKVEVRNGGFLRFKWEYVLITKTSDWHIIGLCLLLFLEFITRMLKIFYWVLREISRPYLQTSNVYFIIEKKIEWPGYSDTYVLEYALYKLN